MRRLLFEDDSLYLCTMLKALAEQAQQQMSQSAAQTYG
jgi:hypothetical protein